MQDIATIRQRSGIRPLASDTLTVPRRKGGKTIRFGGGLANRVRDGRVFLKCTACSRCGLERPSTDFFDNGIASTMPDDNTVLNAKQVLANSVLSSVLNHLLLCVDLSSAA